jgi:hypothetical protein
MPRGPQGQKRPTDTNANAVHVMKLLTGEVEEDLPAEGKVNGGKARAASMTGEERSELARTAARARWGT